MPDCNPSLDFEEHLVPFGNNFTWSRMTCPPTSVEPRPAIVVLHGGPGIAHDYCLPMAELARSGYPVIHYDQIGCGRSSHMPDAPASFWTVDLFVEELKNLAAHYALENTGFHLLGQSWGGMLAPEYALKYPQDILTMTLANSPASMPLWVKGVRSLLARMPESVQRTVQKHEEAGTTQSKAYTEAVEAFYHQFLCRVNPFPAHLEASFAALEEDPTVYQTMIGPSEFFVTGNLRAWSIIQHLHRITQPSLVMAGEHDEARPEAWEPFIEELPDVEHHLFDGASHTPHLECPEAFVQVVSDFLNRHNNPRGNKK